MSIDTQHAVNRESLAVTTKRSDQNSSLIAPVEPIERQELAQPEQALPAVPSTRYDDLGNPSSSPESLGQVVEYINDYVQKFRRTIEFTVDGDTGTTVVKMLDAETDEIIRQFPSEVILALARHLQSNQASQAKATLGLFFQARA